MTVTDVKVLVRNEPKLKAYAVVTFDCCFVVRDIRIIQGTDRLFVAMPSRKRPNGKHRDVAHPLNAPTREMIEARVLTAYQEALSSGCLPMAGDDGDGNGDGPMDGLDGEESKGNRL